MIDGYTEGRKVIENPLKAPCRHDQRRDHEACSNRLKTGRFFPDFLILDAYLKSLFALEPVDNVQVKGMDEVGVVIAFQFAL